MEYELYHHGVLGMKWGVRRFQKKDGTLTAAGKKRYDPNAAAHPDYAKNHASRSIMEMSDEELRGRLSRLQLEKQYKDILAASQPQRVSGMAAVTKFLATSAALTGSAVTLYGNAKKLMTILNSAKKSSGSA